jgi:hypothetical protein
MPVTKQHAGRVVAAPARCKRYNIPDSELKGLGLRVEPPRQDGAATKSWYVQAMAGGRRFSALASAQNLEAMICSSGYGSCDVCQHEVPLGYSLWSLPTPPQAETSYHNGGN